MKRLVLVALGLAVLAFLIARGSEEKPEKPAEEPTGYEDPLAAVPLPETPHRDVLDEARGLYVLESEKARFSLELMREGRFRFLSPFVGKEQREAHGKWNLVDSRLTMVYERVNGAPPEGTAEVVNRYRGSSIELLNTGLDFPVVLQKRAMLKQTPEIGTRTSPCWRRIRIGRRKQYSRLFSSHPSQVSSDTGEGQYQHLFQRLATTAIRRGKQCLLAVAAAIGE